MHHDHVRLKRGEKRHGPLVIDRWHAMVGGSMGCVDCGRAKDNVPLACASTSERWKEKADEEDLAGGG
jgi:hypothetical protein